MSNIIQVLLSLSPCTKRLEERKIVYSSNAEDFYLCVFSLLSNNATNKRNQNKSTHMYAVTLIDNVFSLNNDLTVRKYWQPVY